MILLIFFVIVEVSIAWPTANTSAKLSLISIPPPIKSGKKTFYVEAFFTGSWHRAEQFCRYHGMDLASVKNAQEQADLNNGLKSISEVAKDFWTSGNDLAQKSFVWSSDGSTFSYTNWHPDQPSHFSHEKEPENCVLLANWGDKNYKWNDARCHTERYFICQTENKI